ncbi:MAG TPA: dihydroorotase [Candidatus Limnocylindrales bacterium]|nr:dihydroorotase [Candidatus Limnocylindrales bacterium]
MPGREKTQALKRDLAARGLLITRGFVDLHAHLREPGFEDSETIATGARAALLGGFTTICAMPNTEPAIDTPGLVAEVIARGDAARGARVLPIATITRGRKGKQLADLIELSAAGAVAFSDDGAPVEDTALFRHALEYAHGKGLLVIEHPQDLSLSGKGVMNDGVVSAALGLPGIPSSAEESAVTRAILIATELGARVHLTHLSTAGAMDIVRAAKARGARVTCDVTPHHLALTDDWVRGRRALAWEQGLKGQELAGSAAYRVPYDANTKMNPPLRTLHDVRALWIGLVDGTVDAIATDHAPHASVHKEVEFDQAAFGISGLETALSLVLGGVDAGWCDLDTALRALSDGPARVLGIAQADDDWIAIDRDATWTVTAEGLATRGKNTPLLGHTMRGRVVAAVVGGELRYEGGVRGEAQAVG